MNYEIIFSVFNSDSEKDHVKHLSYSLLKDKSPLPPGKMS